MTETVSTHGFTTVRFGDRPWEPRTDDEWPCLVKHQVVDEASGTVVRTVWYPRDAVEPRHVHEGTHAAVILLGATVVDGIVLGPWDAIYGPGSVPHGPHRYPMGCMLFALISGGAFHTAVDGGAGRDQGESPPQLVVASQLPWLQPPQSASVWACERKILVQDPERSYASALLRWPRDVSEALEPFSGAFAAVVLSGSLVVDGLQLGPWDVVYSSGEGSNGGFRPTAGCTLAVCIHGSQPREVSLSV